MKSKLLILFLIVITSPAALTAGIDAGMIADGWAIVAAEGMVNVDSLLPVSIDRGVGSLDKAAFAELQEIEASYGRSGDHRKALARLLDMAGLRAAFCTRKVRFRLYRDLAKVSTRLRMYSLAMRCYYNACKAKTELPGDSGLYRALPVAESLPIEVDSLISGFRDGRVADFYAVLLEIKQPIAGKRKAYTHINNVGHSFITLIKYNRDGSIVTRSFGYYPQKSGFLSATPLQPSARGVFKDDSRHDWDEAAARLLSSGQFEAILRVLKSYDHRRYHLNRSNCTDFGLDAASVAGIAVRETSGSWPFGHGNNPGSAGQSLLEGKVDDLGASSEGFLMIDNIARDH